MVPPVPCRPLEVNLCACAGTLNRRRQLAQRAQLADQGFVDVQNARAPAMDHMKGRRSQKLTHVRACDAHVHRMERLHHASSAIAGFSAVLGEDGLSVRTYTGNFCYSHLDEAGEPWGATRGPQGRRGQPPDGSDGHGVAHPNLRGGEGVKEFWTHGDRRWSHRR